MEITLAEPDGLHLLPRASLAQLAGDETLGRFAGGLLRRTLEQIDPVDREATTLAEALYHSGSRYKVLLTALLALDAEVRAIVEEVTRVLPLPAFLHYRSALSAQTVSLTTVRLPPLNPAGHYLTGATPSNSYLVARLDLHPARKVAGHVRLVLSSPTRGPARLRQAEQRLEWQILDRALIETALLAAPLTEEDRAELARLIESAVGS